MKDVRSVKHAYISMLVLVSHEEINHNGNGIDLQQVQLLIVTHLGKLIEEAEVLSQVLAMRLGSMLNLENENKEIQTSSPDCQMKKPKD